MNNVIGNVIKKNPIKIKILLNSKELYKISLLLLEVKIIIGI